MRVRDWMTPDPATVTPCASLMVARRLLRVRAIRHLPVVDPTGELVGIVSDRDLVVRDRAVTRGLQELQSDVVAGRYRTVEETMSRPVRTVGAKEPLEQAAALMERHAVSALPVVQDGRLVGILTTTDCLRALRSPLVTPAPACASAIDDPEFFHMLPMPAIGDHRPGRPLPPTSAASDAVPAPAPAPAQVAIAS